MLKEKLKFVAGAAIILGVLVWLGFAGVQESKTYYVTLPELRARYDSRSPSRATVEGQSDAAYEKKLRVAGDVVPGSIRRENSQVRFELHQGADRLPVVYTGREPLPDTLVDNAQAIVTGRYTPAGVFEAQQVQAKCASKYEALPPGVKPPNAASGS